MTLPSDKHSRLTAERIEQLRAEWGECWTPTDEEFHALLDMALSAVPSSTAAPEPTRVPICGAKGVTVSRAIWDEAWLAYGKLYGSSESQHKRLLREGFYAEELDTFRPGWRPVDQRIAQLEAAPSATRLTTENGEALAAALEPFANYAIRTLEIEGDGKDNPDSKWAFTNLTYGHFRAAVQAMRGVPETRRADDPLMQACAVWIAAKDLQDGIDFIDDALYSAIKAARRADGTAKEKP